MASPSPPLSISSSTPTASQHISHHNTPNSTWHFPGPSSKYHHRERSQSYQSPSHKTTYVPHAPVLSTEKRASHHRRAASSVNLFSPPNSECGRSPLARFHSYTPKMSSSMSSVNTRLPSTPARSPEARRSASLQNSPFSDYFTDDERIRDRAIYTAPKPETQQVIMRLQKLQAQLMREDEGDDVLHTVWKKMNEIEDQMHSVSSHSRPSPRMQDSGFFTDEDHISEKAIEEDTFLAEDSKLEDDKFEPSMNSDEVEQGPQPAEEEGLTKAEKQAEHDFAMLEAQRILANVTKAQEQLRRRYAEFRDINNSSTDAIEEREQELEHLRSENERLRSDVGFDHSELLFLKLQFKALEIEVSDLEGSKGISEMKRSKIMKEMKSWRTDWRAVERKFKRRLSGYGVLAKVDKDLRSDSPIPQPASDDEDGWHLESVKKDLGGNVQSITIRRLRSSGELGEDQLQESSYLPQSSGKTGNAPQAPQNSPPSLPRRQTREQSTQTSPSPAINEPSHQGQGEGEGEGDEQPDPAPNEDNIATDPVPLVRPEKTPWQDLWTGLSNLAGFAGDDDDDDEGAFDGF